SQQLGDGELDNVGGKHAGVEFGNVEQGVKQLVHRQDRSVDPLNQPAALGGFHVAAQLRDEQAECMQRLAQIVTRRRKKPGFRQVRKRKLMGAFLDLAFEARIGVLQLFGHAVKLLGERLKLIASSYRDALSEIAAADAGGASADRLDRNHHAARQEQ